MATSYCKCKPSSSNMISRGFSLLEIMVALAIIGIALISLLALGNRSLDVNERLQKITVATLLAQQKMTDTEYQASRDGLAGMSEEEGGFKEPYNHFRWQRTINATPLPAVRMVTITVLWGDAEYNESVDVTSFLF